MPLLLEFSQCNVEAISNVRVFMPAYNEREKKRETGRIYFLLQARVLFRVVFFFFFKKKDYLKTERCDKNRQVTRNSLVTEIRFTHL